MAASVPRHRSTSTQVSTRTTPTVRTRFHPIANRRRVRCGIGQVVAIGPHADGRPVQEALPARTRCGSARTVAPQGGHDVPHQPHGVGGEIGDLPHDLPPHARFVHVALHHLDLLRAAGPSIAHVRAPRGSSCSCDRRLRRSVQVRRAGQDVAQAPVRPAVASSRAPAAIGLPRPLVVVPVVVRSVGRSGMHRRVGRHLVGAVDWP